ncbi:MAG: PAS domain-containing sensor histidine kinase [Oculatellaceae cyanobacterium bins.114]|nr:PAS domain-containing sensor histidine kinase [Oculatellaceae cyanobacterium bins.114]
MVTGGLGFLLGLAIGLLLWWRQRSRSDAKIKTLLRALRTDTEESGLPSTSQLTTAIATQQKVRQQLEQQLESYRQVLHAAPVGYLQVDDENRLIWCNERTRELLHMTQEHYPRPRLLLELVRSYELDHLIEQTRNSKKNCQSDWTFHPASPDPSRLSKQQAYALRGYGFPLPWGQVGIFLEDRREAITLMQQRDRWASDVAHELKTPLTSIRLVAETLQTRLDPPLRGWVNRLINETMRLGTLVQDLLDLSHIDRGSSQCLNLKTTDLVELVQAAWLNLEPLARKKQLQLDYIGPEHLLIQIDEPRIYRVLINLLDNSIKYSPPWQTIRVQLRIEKEPVIEPQTEGETAPGQVCLDIIDAGLGFTENDLPHVFERFYRADPSRSRQILTMEGAALPTSSADVIDVTDGRQKNEDDRFDLQRGSGSGLGLAIVRQIVEAHSGVVMASNHPETGGAWLQVYLPWQS